MTSHVILNRLFLFLLLIACSRLPARAEEPPASYKVGKRQVNFKYVVVFPAESKGEKRIVALATGQKLSADVIDKILAEDVDAQTHSLGASYFKAVYSDRGELKHFHAGGLTSLFATGDEVQSDLKIEQGRAKGNLLLQTRSVPGEITASMDFDVPFGVPDNDDEPNPSKPPSKPVVSGRFLQDGKPFKLTFVSAQPSEPINGKEAIWLVFTEVDQFLSHGRRRPNPPWIDARGGAYRRAFVLQVNEQGGIWVCEVIASSTAKLVLRHAMHMVEFEIIDGRVQGILTTAGEAETPFGTFDIDLKFNVPISTEWETVGLRE